MNATMHEGNVPAYEGNALNFKIQFPLTKDWCLIVDLAQNYTRGTELSFQVFYTTGQNSEGLQWLNANQTADGKYPFMYTACKETQCRSIAPMMDTLAIRQTYGACIMAD